MKLGFKLGIAAAAVVAVAIPVGIAVAVGAGGDKAGPGHTATAQARQEAQDSGAGGLEAAPRTSSKPTARASAGSAGPGAAAGTGAGGGGGVAPGEPPPAPLPKLPPTAYTSSGGVSGQVDRIAIDESGYWARTVDNAPRGSGQLTGAQLRNLDGLLRSPQLAAEANGRAGWGGQCVDIPVQTLTTGGLALRHDCKSGSMPMFSQVVQTIHAYTSV